MTPTQSLQRDFIEHRKRVEIAYAELVLAHLPDYEEAEQQALAQLRAELESME